MGVYAGPRITSGNTALTLDANNLKSYDKYENRFTYSEQFDNAAWTKSNVLITTNTIAAPDGTTTAEKMAVSGSAGNFKFVSQGTILNNTISVFVKSAEYQYASIGKTNGAGYWTSVNFNLSTGQYHSTVIASISESPISYGIVPYANGWYRIWASFSNALYGESAFIAGSIDGDPVFGATRTNAGNGTSGIYIWGAQLENGNSVNDYYTTTASIKVRGTNISDISGSNRSTEPSVTDTFYKVYDLEVADYVIPNSPAGALPTFGNNSIIFDGIGNYLNFSSLNLGSSITIEMLVNLGTNYSNNTIISFGGYTVWCGFGGLGFNTSNADLYGISSANVSSLGLVNNWKHYTFEMRSDVAYTNNKLYINGQNQTLSQQTGSELSTNRNFNNGSGRISSWSLATGYEMPMNMAFIRVYNRTFTASEIASNFIATRARYGI